MLMCKKPILSQQPFTWKISGSARKRENRCFLCLFFTCRQFKANCSELGLNVLQKGGREKMDKINCLELEEKIRKDKIEQRRKKENWLGLLERLNNNGKYVWAPIVIGGKIIGVRKIRPL
jgi:hypothetical protein